MHPNQVCPEPSPLAEQFQLQNPLLQDDDSCPLADYYNNPNSSWNAPPPPTQDPVLATVVTSMPGDISCLAINSCNSFTPAFTYQTNEDFAQTDWFVSSYCSMGNCVPFEFNR